MASELNSIPFPSPRSRPRAATDMSPTATASSFSFRRQSHGVSYSTVSHGHCLDAGNQILGARELANSRFASGPLRHPKPLTPSDIHFIVEQEQEAFVNRLSRELSLLRQQTASVTSTTSSTSTTLNDALDAIHGSTYITGPIHPTASRRHRSSSSLSASYFPIIQGSRTSSISAITPSRETYLPSPRPRDPSQTRGRSPAPSLALSRQSENVVSSIPSHYQVPKQIDPSTPLLHSPCLNSHVNFFSQQKTPTSSLGPHSDEVSHRLGELESVKRENEMLRHRIRELERELRLQKPQKPEFRNTASAVVNETQVVSGTDAGADK